MISLEILFCAWPRWMGPLAYGGPSCRTNLSCPSFLAIDLLVDVVLLPHGEALGLVGGQARAHRKARARQVGRLLVLVLRHASSFVMKGDSPFSSVACDEKGLSPFITPRTRKNAPVPPAGTKRARDFACEPPSERISAVLGWPVSAATPATPTRSRFRAAARGRSSPGRDRGLPPSPLSLGRALPGTLPFNASESIVARLRCPERAVAEKGASSRPIGCVRSRCWPDSARTTATCAPKATTARPSRRKRVARRPGEKPPFVRRCRKGSHVTV